MIFKMLNTFRLYNHFRVIVVMISDPFHWQNWFSMLFIMTFLCISLCSRLHPMLISIVIFIIWVIRRGIIYIWLASWSRLISWICLIISRMRSRFSMVLGLSISWILLCMLSWCMLSLSLRLVRVIVDDYSSCIITGMLLLLMGFWFTIADIWLNLRHYGCCRHY